LSCDIEQLAVFEVNLTDKSVFSLSFILLTVNILSYLLVCMIFGDRLRSEKLENEKKELLRELQSLRRKVNPAAGGPSDVVSLCL